MSTNNPIVAVDKSESRIANVKVLGYWVAALCFTANVPLVGFLVAAVCVLCMFDSVYEALYGFSQSDTVRRIPDTVKSIAQNASPMLPDALRKTTERVVEKSVSSSAMTRTGSPDPVREATPDLQDTALFRKLNSASHRLIVGFTGGGKTTLIHALATGWAKTDRVYVADPDAANGMWPGCVVAGGGDDYEGIAKMLVEIDTIIDRRRKEREEGTRSFDTIHVVIDESQDVIHSIPSALSIIEDILRRGRKIDVRLTLGVQDSQVRTLGLEGKSHLLINMIRAEVKMRDGKRIAQFDDEIINVPQLRDPETLIVKRFMEKTRLPDDFQATYQRLPGDLPNRPEETPGKSVLASSQSDSGENLLAYLLTSESEKSPLFEDSDTMAEHGKSVGDLLLNDDEMIYTLSTEQILHVSKGFAQGVSSTRITETIPGYSPRKFRQLKLAVDETLSAMKGTRS